MNDPRCYQRGRVGVSLPYSAQRPEFNYLQWSRRWTPPPQKLHFWVARCLSAYCAFASKQCCFVAFAHASTFSLPIYQGAHSKQEATGIAPFLRCSLPPKCLGALPLGGKLELGVPSAVTQARGSLESQPRQQRTSRFN